MGNGVKKLSEIVSPPSSPTPHMSKKGEATTPGSSAKKRRRSPKNTLVTSKTKKSPAKRVNSVKKATPENKNANVTIPIEDEFGTPRSSLLTPSPKKRGRSPKNASIISKREKRQERKTKTETDSITPTQVSSENEDVTKESDSTEKEETQITMDVRVHRLRHMRYLAGSVSALTPTSTVDGQVVVARTDGSYELKSILSSLMTDNRCSDNVRAPRHQLITIAETSPVTGRKDASENKDENSSMEDDDNNGELEPCHDAASSLCWVDSCSAPICVGSGPNGYLWVVDFKSSRPIEAVSSGGGGIFDLSTCKFLADSSSGLNSLPFVAGACEDGSVRIWRITLGSDGQGKIQDPPFVTLPSAGAPVLSLTWKNVSVLKQGMTTAFQTVVFAAIADGTIRKYSLNIEQQSSSSAIESNGENSNGKMKDSHDVHFNIPNPPKSVLRMTIENKGRKDPTKVWTLLLLQDNTLVAGNSLGQVQFWNGETGTLTQTVIQSNSQADVLKIVANADGTKLFCSGVDSRIVCLERRKLPIATSPQEFESELTALVTSHITAYRPWKMTISQRPHTHDVKAMAIVTSSLKNISSPFETLLTGGLDTKICTYSVSSFAHSQPHTWYPWPSATSLFSSTSCVQNKNPKLVSMQRHDRIELYQLETSAVKNKANRSKYLKQGVAQYPTSIPVGTIQLGRPDEDDKGGFNSSSSSPLKASTLSPNGKFLAVSNTSSMYVFQLKMSEDQNNNDGSVRLQMTKLILPKKLQNVSASTFLFTSDELYIGDSSDHQKVHVLRLPSEKNKKDDESHMDVEGEDNEMSLDVQSVSLPDTGQSTNFEDIMLPIQSIHADGEFMVTSCHARENAVHIFRRRHSSSSFELFWTLPSLGGGADDRPAAVALLDKKSLAVATYRSHLYVLDIETRSLNEWSEQHGFPIKKKKWTDDSLCGRGYPIRLLPQNNGRLVMTSFGTFCIIDLSKPMPRRCRTVPKRRVWKNRREYKPIVYNDDNDDGDENDNHWLEPRVTNVVEDEYSHYGDDDDDEVIEPSKNSSNIIPQEVTDGKIASKNCTICSHYKNMLYVDFLGPKEMIIVEQPWSAIAETFPAALQRRIYGAD